MEFFSSGLVQEAAQAVIELLSAGYVGEARFDGVEAESRDLVTAHRVGVGESEKVVVHVAAEVGGVVRVDGHAKPLAQQLDDIVFAHVIENPQLDVGQRANGERHVAVDQLAHQLRILDAAHPVIDARHLEQFDGITDVTRRTFFARVRDREKTGVARGRENAREF